jgi:hypothetical protein
MSRNTKKKLLLQTTMQVGSYIQNASHNPAKTRQQQEREKRREREREKNKQQRQQPNAANKETS